MSHRALALFLATFWVAVTSFTFLYNLPHWCTEPERNEIVQPICAR